MPLASMQLPLSELESAMFKPYVKKLIKNFDQRQQALDSGMAIRPITAAEILQHLSEAWRCWKAKMLWKVPS